MKNYYFQQDTVQNGFNPDSIQNADSSVKDVTPEVRVDESQDTLPRTSPDSSRVEKAAPDSMSLPVNQEAPPQDTIPRQVKTTQYRKPVVEYQEESIPYLLSKQEKESLRKFNLQEQLFMLDEEWIFPVQQGKKIYSEQTLANPSSSKNYQHYLKESLTSQETSNKRLGDYGITGVIFLIFVLLIWAKIIFSKYFNALLKAPYNYSLSTSLYHDKNTRLSSISVLLNIIFGLSTSLFLYQLIQHFNIDPFHYSPSLYFLIFFVALHIMYFVKSMVCNFLGNVFHARDAFGEYVYAFYTLNKNVGIYLLPVNIMLAIFGSVYMPELTYIGGGVIAYFFLLRLLRGLQIIFYRDISILYMFLYLCTLEILPLVIIYKWLESLI